MPKYEKVGVILTAILKELITVDPYFKNPANLKTVVEGIRHYAQEYINNIKRGIPEEEVLLNFYLKIDEFLKDMPRVNKFQIRCTKGCNFCCHIKVDISPAEARLIINWCQENNIDIDREYLENQKDLTSEETYWISKFKKCVFLKDGLCSIYHVRPMACRKYFVGSDPQGCNTDNGIHGKVSVVFDINTEMLVSGVASYNKEQGTMANMLLQELNKKPKDFESLGSLNSDQQNQ